MTDFGLEDVHVCKDFQSLRQFIWGLTIRDRSFMRALVHYNYLGLRKDMRQMCFLIREPHVKFYTAFDYSEGPVTVAVVGVSTDGKGTGYHEPELVTRWEDHVRRASRSGGRMEVHTMGIRVGDPLIVPLRTHSWEIHNGVTELAERVAEEMIVNPGGDASTLYEEVDDLLRIPKPSNVLTAIFNI
ncbi:hypothetical protein C8R44DRAFT_885822 [Mycena epipterygia]|nr:hypothetical protein C8R44DRAFT_885822 [Mycena epipterygia]